MVDEESGVLGCGVESLAGGGMGVGGGGGGRDGVRGGCAQDGHFQVLDQCFFGG